MIYEGVFKKQNEEERWIVDTKIYRINMEDLGRYGGVGRGARSPLMETRRPGSGSTSSTPPPPGISPPRMTTPEQRRSSPYPDRTPEGVFTQVQRRPMAELPVHEVSAIDDSFENSQLGTQSSDLTGVFPGIRIQCKLPDPVPTRRDEHQDGMEEYNNNTPDFLTKVLQYTVTATEERQIEMYEFNGPIEGNNELADDWLQSQDSVRAGNVVRTCEPLDSMPSAGLEAPCRSTPAPAAFMEIESANPKPDLERQEHFGGTNSIISSVRSSGTEAQFREEDRVQRLLGSLSPVPRASINTSDSSFTLTSIPSFIEEERRRLQDFRRQKEEQEREEIASCPQTMISEEAQEIAEAVGKVKHATVKCVDGKVVETGLRKHYLPMVHRRIMGEARTSLDQIEDKVYNITIPEVVTSSTRLNRVNFDSKIVAKFLLVAQHHSTKKWSIPAQTRFHDVLNMVETKIWKEKVRCQGVMEWTSMWSGGIGMMGLRVDDMVQLTVFRNLVASIRIGELWYNTFPKVALPEASEISVVLRAEVRKLELEYLPHSLFEKNHLLDGAVGVRYSKDLGSTDSGYHSGSRLVILEGDEDFFQSVRRYPANHPFRIGSITVKLRGDKDDEEVKACMGYEHGREVLSRANTWPPGRGESSMEGIGSSAVGTGSERSQSMTSAMGSGASEVHLGETSSGLKWKDGKSQRGRGRGKWGKGRGRNRGGRGAMMKPY